MYDLLALIKTVLSIVLPIVVLHYFSSTFYNLSFWEVTKWWAANISKTENATPYALGMFFSTFMYYLLIVGLINILTLTFSGENQELVYLGNKKQNNAVYYDVDDISKTSIQGHDVENMYNFTFDNIYRTQSFVKDLATSNNVGTKANQFHIFSLISLLIGFLAFSLTTIIIYNLFVHATYVANPTDITLPIDSPLLAFDTIASQYNLNRSGYFILMAVLILGWLGFSMATPKNKLSKPITTLPAHVYSGATIEGIPNEIQVKYIKQRRGTDSTKYDDVDSGERYINFEFSKGFNPPIYVTTLINVEDYATEIKNIEHHISNNIVMTVNIDSNLGISIPKQH